MILLLSTHNVWRKLISPNIAFTINIYNATFRNFVIDCDKKGWRSGDMCGPNGLCAVENVDKYEGK